MTNDDAGFSRYLRNDLPPAAARWNGFPAFNFVGGHNDPDSVPVEDLRNAADAVLRREGATLATYGLESGPLGYHPLRAFLSDKLKQQAGIEAGVEDILITSGSLQGLDLVNTAMLSAGDTVIVEQETYGGSLTRLQRLGVTIEGAPLDQDGIRMDILETMLTDLASRSIRPKFIYTIPTVQNPTGSIMPLERRHELLRLAEHFDVPIFEDECYSDLIWDGERPPALYALDGGARVIYIGSFSKSIAPALRVGYVVAPSAVLRALLAVKTDAGSGALEQMVLAEYCPSRFETHVPSLNKALKAKLDALIAAIEEHFGTSAEFVVPKGGIFLWLKLPDAVDTSALFKVASAEGVAFNPGREWSTEQDASGHCLRLCFANPDVATIKAGVAKLAEICHRETGIPTRIANRPMG